ncbi:MAG: hypothetical protein EOM24_25710, partial [Chloroflexia bacterium]|nr:hypothetical protein [Chloroflexia bacterium]
VQAQADQGRMVFVSYHEAEGKSAISVINPDGSGLTRLTSFDTRGDYAHPVWSPDGSQIAFTIYQQFRADAWHSDIYVMQADGSNIRRLTRLDWASQPVWSPDGQRIAFIQASDGLTPGLFTMNADGSDIVQVQTGLDMGEGSGRWLAGPAWSPDGTRIAFTSGVAVEVEGMPIFHPYSDIFVVDSNGGNAQLLVSGASPAWSPDGSRLAFSIPAAGEARSLAIIRADGSNETYVALGESFYIADQPTWSPDGAKIAFYAYYVTMSGASNDIYVMNADGSGVTKLANGQSPNWSRPAGSPAPAPPPPAGDQRCFAETGFCIAGRIRSYWEQNGGLPVFGFPLTEQREEMIEGRAIQVQWFERNRLELHPANPRPYDVLLGRLGADRLGQRGYDWQAVPAAAPQAGCRFFAETGRNVCGAILAAWRANGLELDGRPGFSESENLALFGLPLTGLITEQLSDGREYQVQYFERARFELHPENAPPYHVLLGLLGSE